MPTPAPTSFYQEYLPNGYIVLQILSPILVVLIAAWLASRTYFKQKSYELVRQRYLEGAIDIIAAQHEDTMNIWTHNWSHAIKLVSFLVIHNTLFNAKELEGGFIEYKATGFQRIAHKRLHHLVKSRIFWDIHELAMTYIKTYNDQITSDIPKAIQLILTGMTIQTPYELSLLANNLIQTLDYRIQKFSVLTEALGNLSFILEKENMRLEHVDQFHNIPNVQSIVKNLENSYNDLKDFLSQPIDATPLP